MNRAAVQREMNRTVLTDLTGSAMRSGVWHQQHRGVPVRVANSQRLADGWPAKMVKLLKRAAAPDGTI
jgi:hypothetical protein